MKEKASDIVLHNRYKVNGGEGRPYHAKQHNPWLTKPLISSKATIGTPTGTNKNPTIMKVKLIATVMVMSFVICAITVCSLGIVFWVSLAVLACTSVYVNRHAEELESGIDEIFGRDERFE